MKIKWGVIGCGGIADRRTIPGMMLADNAELIAVMDANLSIAEKVKEKYKAKYAFDNYEELQIKRNRCCIYRVACILP